MIRFLLCIFVLIVVGCGKRESIDFRTGTLKNGFTYYIKHNEFPKEKASLRLIVKVGSLHETEEERGVAHFLEHMAFRGSRNFTDWEIIRYLESIGAQFGPDTNAFTTFEETCYHLRIPLDKPETLELGMLILSDYAGRLSLKDELIEKERSVILDEYNNTERSSASRISHKLYETFFLDSAYSQRFPIGTEEVILHCKPEVIRNFYQKWYQPNRMAVVAVGDFDLDLMEKEIHRCFGELPCKGSGDPVSIDVTFPKEPVSLYIADSEEAYVQGGFTGFYRKLFDKKINTKNIRDGMMESLLFSILNHRLQDLAKEYPAPFLYAAFHSLPYTTYHEGARFHFVGFSDRPLDGAKALYREVERLKKFGPLRSEFEREISQMREELTSSIANMHRIDHEAFAQTYADHFMHGRGFVGPEKGYALRQKILKTIRSKDLVRWAKKNVSLDDMHRIFSMPEESLLSSDAFEAAIAEVKREKLSPRVEGKEIVLTTVIADSAKITESREHPVLGSKELVLDNGMHVILHPTPLEKGRLSIELVALGGKTLFSPEHYASFELAPTYLVQSGLGNLKGAELQNFLQKRDITLSLGMRANLRFVAANGPKEQAETLLQSIHMIFTQKRFESASWDSLIAQWQEMEKQKDNNPQAFFFEKAINIVYDGHPFYTFSHSQSAKKELARECLETAFSDPRDFSVIIVGDFTIEQMEPLVCKHLHFPELSPHVELKTTLPALIDPAESTRHTICRGSETHGLTLLCYRKNLTGKAVSHWQMQGLTHILTQRMLEKLRQEMGDTYGTFLMYEFPLDPVTDEVQLCAYFTSKPDKAELLQEKIAAILEQFQKEGPTDDEVATTREILWQQVKQGKESNAFWTRLYMQALFTHIEPEVVLSEKESLRDLDRAHLHELSKWIFAGTKSVAVSLSPES